MNILKERDDPKLLKHLRLLNQRLDLTIDQKQYLYNLEKDSKASSTVMNR